MEVDVTSLAFGASLASTVGLAVLALILAIGK
jgi:hypothetical protein